MSAACQNARVTDGQPVVPTRDEIWQMRSAPNAFPSELVTGARTAASFFSAAYYGRNDVIYLDAAGVRDITLVDLAAEKLAAMRNLYPAVTEIYADDAFSVARQLRDAGRSYDVVICDPFTGDMCWPVFADHFETFATLARRSWITGLATDDLTRAGVPATRAGVQTWLDANGHDAFEAAWFKLRNKANGASWVGLRRRPTLLRRLASRLMG
jgi:hypothetical protein